MASLPFILEPCFKMFLGCEPWETNSHIVIVWIWSVPPKSEVLSLVSSLWHYQEVVQSLEVGPIGRKFRGVPLNRVFQLFLFPSLCFLAVRWVGSFHLPYDSCLQKNLFPGLLHQTQSLRAWPWDWRVCLLGFEHAFDIGLPFTHKYWWNQLCVTGILGQSHWWEGTTWQFLSGRI